MWPPEGYEPIDPAHVRRHPPWRVCFYASLCGVLFLVWRYSSYDTAPTAACTCTCNSAFGRKLADDDACGMECDPCSRQLDGGKDILPHDEWKSAFQACAEAARARSSDVCTFVCKVHQVENMLSIRTIERGDCEKARRAALDGAMNNVAKDDDGHYLCLDPSGRVWAWHPMAPPSHPPPYSPGMAPPLPSPLPLPAPYPPGEAPEPSPYPPAPPPVLDPSPPPTLPPPWSAPSPSPPWISPPPPLRCNKYQLQRKTSIETYENAQIRRAVQLVHLGESWACPYVHEPYAQAAAEGLFETRTYHAIRGGTKVDRFIELRGPSCQSLGKLTKVLEEHAGFKQMHELGTGRDKAIRATNPPTSFWDPKHQSVHVYPGGTHATDAGFMALHADVCSTKADGTDPLVQNGIGFIHSIGRPSSFQFCGADSGIKPHPKGSHRANVKRGIVETTGCPEQLLEHNDVFMIDWDVLCGFGHLLHGRPTPLTEAKLTLTESHVFHGWSTLKAAGVAEILQRELPKMAPQQPLPRPQLDEDAVIEFWNRKFTSTKSAVLTDPDNADSDPGVVSQIVDKVAFLKLFEGKKVGVVLG